MSNRETLREQHLVETEWLANRLGDPSIQIVDMRGYVHTQTEPDGYQTAQYVGAPEEYQAGHIPGAVYLDWTRDIVDLEDPVPAQIAPPERFAEQMGRSGIGDETLVVVYDHHKSSQFATRLWWALRYYGHRNCRVLNGGWAKWFAENRPVSTTPDAPPRRVFTPRVNTAWRITAEEMLQEIGNRQSLLLDTRDEGQYTGQIRRGPRGGHIPGAIHAPRGGLFLADGTFADDRTLAAVVERIGITPARRCIAYCNGGVAATTLLFTLSMLGFPDLCNYDGSWNEWSRRPELPVETD